MSYDFETIFDRRNTGSFKWNDPAFKNSRSSQAYPFSVADMEFKTAPEIISAMKDFASEGFFGYTQADEIYQNAVTSFMLRRHSWQIEGESIVVTPGVVSALNTAIRAFTAPNDGVIIQQPVYYPFISSIENNGRKLKNNPLVRTENSYKINFDELETLAKEKSSKLMFFCSPHNPVGRVWTEEEVLKVARICKENDIILISDDVHFDICAKPHKAINSIDESMKENTIVCTSISKSFNLAGLSTANIIIENEDLRRRFKSEQQTDGTGMLNSFGRAATIAAYSCCDNWLTEMNKAVDNNFSVLKAFIQTELSDALLFEREGTYLAWIDMSFLNMQDEKLFEFLTNDCGVIPDPGIWFGDEGSGFTRLNLAVPEKALTDGLERIATAVKKLI